MSAVVSTGHHYIINIPVRIPTHPLSLSINFANGVSMFSLDYERRTMKKAKLVSIS